MTFIRIYQIKKEKLAAPRRGNVVLILLYIWKASLKLVDVELISMQYSAVLVTYSMGINMLLLGIIPFFKTQVDEERAAVVWCGCRHTRTNL